MKLRAIVARARRGLRGDLRLYLVAVACLTVAFVCLGAALWGLENLAALHDRFAGPRRLTVLLRESPDTTPARELRAALAELVEVRSVRPRTAAELRDAFLADSALGEGLEALPADLFPASLEVTLVPGIDRERIRALAERIGRFPVVEGVETYEGWLGGFDRIVLGGRIVVGGLALLVLLSVLAVVGGTIRLTVAGRRAEIEVMKLCGATDGFVRGPFLVEGAVQGVVAAALATALLAGLYVLGRDALDATVGALTGGRTAFLAPWMLVAMWAGAALAGAVGSAVSLRRYLTV
ncbi:MAG: hypothetical protein NZ898_07415 [Myxococcota bacterium]|nr:hypothetical protein [Myxococcota bacterium]